MVNSFIERGNIEMSPIIETSPNLYRVSMQVEAVRAECLKKLTDSISIDTALQYYSTADKYTEDKLKDACTSFIAQSENRYTLLKSVHTINCLCHYCAHASILFVKPGQLPIVRRRIMILCMCIMV